MLFQELVIRRSNQNGFTWIMKKDNIDYKALCEKMAKLSNSEIVEGYDSFGRFIIPMPRKGNHL